MWIRIRGSMPLTKGSGSGFGSRSCYFHHWSSRSYQKTNLKKVFLHITFWSYIYIIFQKLKVKKKSQNSRNQGFSYHFCLMIEGSGSISVTDGSGSRCGFGSGSATLNCNVYSHMSTESPHLVLVVKLEQNWQTYWRTRLFLASMTYTTLSKLAPPPSSSSPLSAEVSEPTRRDKFEAVLGIPDIGPLTCGSGSDSFLQWG